MSVLQQIIRQQNSAKFGGVFGAAKTLYSYQGFGVWNKSYTPTKNAFINELKSRGFADVQFSITRNETSMPIYSFLGTIASTTHNLASIRQLLLTYFSYYFNDVRLEVQQQTNILQASGSVYNKRVFTFTGNNLINVPVLEKKIDNLGYQNTIVTGAWGINTITVTTYIPSNVSDETAKQQIKRIIDSTSLNESTLQIISANANAGFNATSATVQTIYAQVYNAASDLSKKTGKTLNESISTVTNGAVNSVEALGKAADNMSNPLSGFSLDSLLTNDTVKKLALALGVSSGIAVLLLFAGGAVFLKIFLSLK